MKKIDTFAAQAPLDRIGRELARQLNQASAELPHDVSERLRIARQQALAVRKCEPVLQNQVQVHVQGSSLTLSGPPSEGLGLWSILGSALPLLALVIGLVAMDVFDHEQFVSEIAEIDAALLVDDLPPSAYSDPGFVQFLRQATPPARTQD